MGPPGVTIKALTHQSKFLQEMMYEALFIPAGAPTPPREIIWEPNLSKYHMHWGREGDCGLIAEVNNEEVGAIWCRLFTVKDKSYGFVSPEIPEMVIALKAPFRNRGIGTKLISALHEILREEGTEGISLSVQKDNRAIQLYRRLGFKPVDQVGTAYTMLWRW